MKPILYLIAALMAPAAFAAPECPLNETVTDAVCWRSNRSIELLRHIAHYRLSSSTIERDSRGHRQLVCHYAAEGWFSVYSINNEYREVRSVDDLKDLVRSASDLSDEQRGSVALSEPALSLRYNLAGLGGNRAGDLAVTTVTTGLESMTGLDDPVRSSVPASFTVTSPSGVAESYVTGTDCVF